jgi:hypothetical protein
LSVDSVLSRHKGWEQNSYNINFAPTATLLVGWQAMMKYSAWQKAFLELKKITDPCTPVGNVVTGPDYASTRAGCSWINR